MAFPNQTADDLESTAVEKFISSIDGSLAATVSTSKPQTLEEAVIVAMDAKAQRNKKVEPSYNRRYIWAFVHKVAHQK